MKIPASALREGHSIPGLDAYVIEVEEGNGYLSYPSTSYGMAAAMPQDTLLITFNDSQGDENYILLSPECMVEVD